MMNEDEIIRHDPVGMHTRYSEDYQEWQLVDNETHEILLTADDPKDLHNLMDEHGYFSRNSDTN